MRMNEALSKVQDALIYSDTFHKAYHTYKARSTLTNFLAVKESIQAVELSIG